MTFSFRPAVRENTPTIIGLAGPSKSGKTYSALRLATGMANGGQIAMINTEGPRGHQYAERFKYVAADMGEPFSMKRYEEAIKAAAALKPAVLIIDSMSHAHEGIGGMLDQHVTELDRMAGQDFTKRQKLTWTAWIKPKADEANMINIMLQLGCHIILCFRAKEKIKIVKGQEPKDLGWQPIASDRVHFETLFTLILPPHSAGVPDMDVSDLREPFDKMIPRNKPLDEELGKIIVAWAAGGAKPEPKPEPKKEDPAEKAAEAATEARVKRESKPGAYVEMLNEAYTRLGPEKFHFALASLHVEKPETVTDRKVQILIYNALKAGARKEEP